jgi:hypothetical protein
MRKRDKKSNSCAAKKGMKKLVSRTAQKYLNKEVAIKIRETGEKTQFTPSNPIKLLILSLLLSDGDDPKLLGIRMKPIQRH